jgi:hypothetical protein
LRYRAHAPYDPAVEFVQPSPFVPRLPNCALGRSPSASRVGRWPSWRWR